MNSPAAFDAENLLRELAPQVLGALVRRFGDFAAAEDAVQEALLAAALQWPSQGVPENPRGWLIQVGARKLTDQWRAEVARRRREEAVQLAAPADQQVAPAADAEPERDDTLLLLFLCCHPTLSRSSAIALTLRAVGGLTTAEIANAFLVPEATMAQRISRAKQKIKSSGEPFRTTVGAEREDRLAAVLHVLYLIFNEGYASSIGDELQRRDLAREAIRLSRAVVRLLPRDPEAAGLLALMLLTDARRRARSGPGGELIPLAEQDRSAWNRGRIEEGLAVLGAAMSRGAVGSYQLQAAIAALHDQAPSTEDTDWPQILALYGLLEQIADNPMVTLNRAVAVAMVEGPQAGLTVLRALETDARIAGHYRLDAVGAHLHEMAGEPTAACERYLAAACKTTNVPERNYLVGKAARLAASNNAVLSSSQLTEGSS